MVSGSRDEIGGDSGWFDIPHRTQLPSISSLKILWSVGRTGCHEVTYSCSNHHSCLLRGRCWHPATLPSS